MEPWVVATSLIFLYLVATIVIGVVANRRLTVDMEDFLLYGRQAGVIVLYLTVVATFHSAFAFLGSGGFFYTHGIGFWVAGTWTVLVGVITYTLGTRIWALGKRFGYITPADMLADFYESDAVRVLTAVVSVIFTILYIQVQSQGLGYILSVASGGRVSFEVGTLILLIAAAAYLIAGGLRAVYWTDVIQGVWMYVAVWVGSLVLVYKLFGGPVELWQRLANRAARPSDPAGAGRTLHAGRLVRHDHRAVVRHRVPASHGHDSLLHRRVGQDAQVAGRHPRHLPDDAVHSRGDGGSWRCISACRPGNPGSGFPGASLSKYAPPG